MIERHGGTEKLIKLKLRRWSPPSVSALLLFEHSQILGSKLARMKENGAYLLLKRLNLSCKSEGGQPQENCGVFSSSWRLVVRFAVSCIKFISFHN